MKNPLLTLQEAFECINQLANLPDDAVIEASMAALYLGISSKTLARYRQNGGGPSYHQYPAPGSTARNQKINYTLADLRSWRNQFKVDSTMDAAVRRGLAFGRVGDLIYQQPFWVNGNIITSHALEMDSNEFVTHLLNTENHIQWITWQKVFSPTWLISENVETHRDAYIKLLTNLITTARK